MASRTEACQEGKDRKEKRKRRAGWLAFLGLSPLWFGLLLGCSEANSQLVARPEPRAAAPAQPPAFPPPAGDAKGPDLPPDPGTKKEPITPVAAPPAVSKPLEPAVFRPEQAVGDPEARIRELHRLAAEHYATVDSYIVRLRRREQVGGKDNPEELLLCRFRRQPFSVYFKWIGPEGNGREVIYVQGRHDDKIHTKTAAGDIPLMPAGRRMALSPDNPLVRSASRHSIREAGIGHLIDLLGNRIAAKAPMKYLGPVQRPEYKQALEGIEETLPPGLEPLLPRGGRRFWFFDPTDHLPTLTYKFDETGHEVEYYCYDLFQYPVKLDDGDFDPDRLWKTAK